jgi:hypothetical protein
LGDALAVSKRMQGHMHPGAAGSTSLNEIAKIWQGFMAAELRRSRQAPIDSSGP